MKYSTYSFLYPPRPVNAIERDSLDGFEERGGYVADIKKNGTNNVMALRPDFKLKAMTRRGTPHEQWNPSDFNANAFRHLKKGWYYFCCELLHNKVPGIRQINYIHDILVFKGEYLTGTTFAERRTLLEGMFVGDDRYGYREIDQHTWLAMPFVDGFRKQFDKIAERAAPEDEGLVLKRLNAPLAFPSRIGANSGWQTKCRLETNSYQF